MKILVEVMKHRPVEILWILLLCLSALLAPYMAGYDPYTVNLAERLQGCSWSHFLGTDEYGRDLFTRVVYGTRIVLYVILLSGVLSGIGGITIGVVAGYFGKWPDLFLSRLIDAIQAFPAILIGIMLAAGMGASLNTAILSVSVFGTPVLARVVRGDVLRIREMDYAEAARAVGAGHTHIIARTILPNVLSSIIIQISSIAPRAVLTVAGLGFLGFGAQPPQPSWGTMIASARAYVYEHPTYLVVVIIALSVTIIVLNLVGDELRDLLAKKQARA